jgi:hypothetical protein
MSQILDSHHRSLPSQQNDKQSKYHKLATFHLQRNEYNELFKLLIMGCEHKCIDCVNMLMNLYDMHVDKRQVFNSKQVAFYQNIWLEYKNPASGINSGKQYRINYLGLLYIKGFGVVKDAQKGFEYYHYAAMFGNIHAMINILNHSVSHHDVYSRHPVNPNVDLAIRGQLCNTLMHALFKHKHHFVLSQKVFDFWETNLSVICIDTTIQLLEYWRFYDLSLFRSALANIWQRIKINRMYKIYVYLLSVSITDKTATDYVQQIILGYTRSRQEEVKYIIRREKNKLYSGDYDDGELSCFSYEFDLKIDEN